MPVLQSGKFVSKKILIVREVSLDMEIFLAYVHSQPGLKRETEQYLKQKKRAIPVDARECSRAPAVPVCFSWQSGSYPSSETARPESYGRRAPSTVRGPQKEYLPNRTSNREMSGSESWVPPRKPSSRARQSLRCLPGLETSELWLITQLSIQTVEPS
jgi:hypothetical protein